MPTWNYAAAHVYGVPRIVEDAAEIYDMLSELVDNHERGRNPAWEMHLPEDYYAKMVRAIVAFEVPIARVEGKYKLSQNRSEADQQSVIAHLLESKYPEEVETAKLAADRRAERASS